MQAKISCYSLLISRLIIRNIETERTDSIHHRIGWTGIAEDMPSTGFVSAFTETTANNSTNITK